MLVKDFLLFFQRWLVVDRQLVGRLVIFVFFGPGLILILIYDGLAHNQQAVIQVKAIFSNSL